MVQQSMSFSEGGSVKYDLFDGVSWEDMNSAVLSKLWTYQPKNLSTLIFQTNKRIAY